MSCKVIQVTNISTQCQKEQVRALFVHLGRIDEIQLYPDSETLTASVGAKVAYIKYDRSEVAQVALQLTNTVFIDRPLLCSLVKSGKIPDETEAVKYCAPLNANVTLICSGATWPNTIINRVVGTGQTSLIETIDPALAERSLPPYPQLPGTMDPLKTEEIRRTVYVSNIPANISLENLNDLFSQVGEIRFIRFAGDENAPIKSAYIEFSEQPYIVRALCLNGLHFAGKNLKVNHATCSIIKPATSKQLFASRDKSPKHSLNDKKSKSPELQKAKKRSRSPRRRSSSRRSRSKKRSKSPHKHSSSTKRHDHDREKRKRSSSKSKKRSRSKDRKRSRSKDLKKRRSDSKSRDRSSKSNKKASNSATKSSRNRSRSRQRKDTKKTKSDGSNSPDRRKRDKTSKKMSEQPDNLNNEETMESKKNSNGIHEKNEAKSIYGPKPPPKLTKENSSSSSEDSNSSFSGSSSEDNGEAMEVK